MIKESPLKAVVFCLLILIVGCGGKQQQDTEDKIPETLAEALEQEGVKDEVEPVTGLLGIDLSVGMDTPSPPPGGKLGPNMRWLKTTDSRYFRVKTDTHEVTGYRWVNEIPAPDGWNEEKDRVPKQKALEIVAEMLAAFNYMVPLKHANVDYEGELAGGPLWVVKLKDVTAVVSAVSGDILAYTRDFPEELASLDKGDVEEAEAREIAREFIRERGRTSFVVKRNPELKKVKPNNLWSRSQGESLRSEEEERLCWYVEVVMKKPRQKLVVFVDKKTGEIMGGI